MWRKMDMDKKYQVFISSTYEDLQEERQKVQEAILSMYQFPIGMEMFSADDSEQWEIIRETIDTSDFYILIIAHRYGSIIKEGKDAGMSYTEKEFRYARSKGIPILAYIISDSVSVLPKNMDTEPAKIRKLNAFKEEVKKGRIVEWWTNCDELGKKVSIALYKQINNKKEKVGWVRLTNENSLIGNAWKKDEKYGVPYRKTTAVPMYSQEDQDTYHFVSTAKEIMFCARTGKGFLNGHYNLLKEFIMNGGHLKFLTSEKLNLLYDDGNEHSNNRSNSILFVKNLYRINPDNVECRVIDEPINLTLLHIDAGEQDFIEAKFIFQTERLGRHPLFRINKGTSYYDEFKKEMDNLWEKAHVIQL